jgi:hypothetical protein
MDAQWMLQTPTYLRVLRRLARQYRAEIGAVGVRNTRTEGLILSKEDRVGTFVAGVPDGPDGFLSLEGGGVFIIILSRVG